MKTIIVKAFIFGLPILLITNGSGYAQITQPRALAAQKSIVLVSGNQKATQQTTLPIPADVSTTTLKNFSQATIKLYAEPNFTARIIEKVEPSERLAAIFDQGEWVKVGDTSNGNVGWINKAERQQVIDAAIRPRVESVTINVADEPQSTPQKPGDIKITVYRNGKKLSDDEAKALYEQFQRDQIELSREMNKMISQTIQDFQKTMNQAVKLWADSANPIK